MYPCEVVERADERRQQDGAARPWLVAEPELDWYDQQLRDEEEAAFRRMTASVDALSDDELEELQAQAAAGAGRDLRAELAAYISGPGRAAHPAADDDASDSRQPGQQVTPVSPGAGGAGTESA